MAYLEQFTFIIRRRASSCCWQFPLSIFYVNGSRYAMGRRRGSRRQKGAGTGFPPIPAPKGTEIPSLLRRNKSRTSAPITSGTHRFKKRIKMKRSVLADMILSKNYYEIYIKCYKSFKSLRFRQKSPRIFRWNHGFHRHFIGKPSKAAGKIVQKMYRKIEERHCRPLLFSVE